jgi:hypothetical protein
MPVHYTSHHFTYLRSVPTWIPLLVTTFLILFLNVFSLQRKDECDFVQTEFIYFRNELSEINLGDEILNRVKFGTLYYGVFRVHWYSNHGTLYYGVFRVHWYSNHGTLYYGVFRVHWFSNQRPLFVITGNRQINKQNIEDEIWMYMLSAESWVL